jgi:hypothetical protein
VAWQVAPSVRAGQYYDPSLRPSPGGPGRLCGTAARFLFFTVRMAETQREGGYGVILWTKHEGEWYFIAQISPSGFLGDVKIDPLRGQRVDQEDVWQTATRELFEESSRLFDFRNSKTAKEIIENQISSKQMTSKSTIFHFQVVFDVKPEHDRARLPSRLIEQYRCNRRMFGGCDRVLDLAVIPRNRMEEPKRYPRFSSEMMKVLKRSEISIDKLAKLPAIELNAKVKDGVVSYCIEDIEVDLKPTDTKEIWFPLMRDGAAWERWIAEHDQMQEDRSFRGGCAVYAKENMTSVTYKFLGPHELHLHQNTHEELQKAAHKLEQKLPEKRWQLGAPVILISHKKVPPSLLYSPE